LDNEGAAATEQNLHQHDNEYYGEDFSTIAADEFPAPLPDFTSIRGVLKHGDRRNNRIRKHPEYSRHKAQHQSYKHNQTHYKLDEQQRSDVSPGKFQGR
jgi:hypothetical protein